MVSVDDGEPAEDAESLPASLSVKVESGATASPRVTAISPPVGAGGRGTMKSLAAGTTAASGTTKSLDRE
jgi:hypothetical protein